MTLDNRWAAGLFEGEGSFTIRRKNGRSYATIQMNSTDKDVLESFRDVVGAGSICSIKATPTHKKPVWKYSAQARKDFRNVVAKISPYLHERRQLQLCSVMIEQSDKFTGRRGGDNPYRDNKGRYSSAGGPTA